MPEAAFAQLPGLAPPPRIFMVYIAAAQDRRDDALALAEEAYATAEACGAQRIMRQVAEARIQIMAPDADHGDTQDEKAL